MENSNLNLFQLSIDNETSEELRRCSYWARIVAIAAFISAALSMIFAFISPEYESQRMLMITVTIMMVVISIVVNVFLYRFATKTTAGINNMNQQDFAEGIAGLQTYFKITGIILIIVLSMIVLAVPVFLIFVSMGMNS